MSSLLLTVFPRQNVRKHFSLPTRLVRVFVEMVPCWAEL